jgi:hypothetical protein
MIELFVLGALALTGLLLFGVIGLALALFAKAAIWLLILPFRLLGLLIAIPLLIFKAVVGLLLGLVVLPVVLLVAGVALAGGLVALAFSLFIPLLPFLVIALVVWLVVKAGTHPVAAAH